MWARQDPETAQKGYVRELQGVFVDGKPFAPFAAAKKAKIKPLVSSRQPAFPLDAAGLATLKGGRTLRFDLVTTLQERVRVVFPLSRSQFTLDKAEELISRNRISPIMTAVIKGDHVGVKKAIAAGENVNARAPNGATALWIAVKMKDPEMIRALGTAKDLSTEKKNSQGDGALHVAAHYYRGTAVLKALLDIGCDPEIRDNEGRTPLGRTVCYDGFGKLELLLKAGADINAADNKGYAPLHHTVRNVFTSPSETAFLIKAGADKNRPTMAGNTPLMVAIDNQCWGHIKQLLDADADLSPKNKKGQDALALAEAYRDAGDLTEKIPTLVLKGKEAIQKTHEAYKNLALMIKAKGLYHIGFHNTTGETVFLALRLIETGDDWVTRSWARIAPGEKKIVARSPNRIFYFFGESKSWAWKGSDNTRTISGKRYGMRKIKLDREDKGKPHYYRLKVGTDGE